MSTTALVTTPTRVIDNSKLRTELAGAPKYTNLREGLQATIDWYAANEAWWRLKSGRIEAKYAEQGQ